MWHMSCSAAVTNRHSLPDHLSLIPIQPFHTRPFHATAAVRVLFALAPYPSSDIDVGSSPVVGSVFCLGWKVEEIKKLRERLKAADAHIIYPTRGVLKPSNPLDHISFGDKHADLSRQCARRRLDRQETDRKRAGVDRARMADGCQGPMERRPSDHRDNRAGPGAFGMTEIDSPIIPTEMLPVPLSNVTPNMNLPTPNPANDSGSGPDAFSASGLTFNADGSINLGLADEGGAYNAGFGSDPGSGSGSGLGKGASSSGQTFPRSIRSPSFMFSAGSSVDPVNEHTRTRPPRRGRGRAGN